MMIGTIRRRFSETVNADLWSVNTMLEPEQESGPRLGYDPTTPQSEGGASFGPGEPKVRDYCRTLVATAIEHNGWYGGMYMSIPWLRMTLAGLESRNFLPEMMWEGVEGQGLGERGAPGVPSYDAVFEAERTLVQKLGRK